MSIAGVGLRLQAMALDNAREAMASAQAAGAADASRQPGGQAAVILELSAAAQQLLGAR